MLVLVSSAILFSGTKKKKWATFYFNAPGNEFVS